MWDSMCDRVRPRLPLLDRGELYGPDRRAVERHLLGCEGCRRLLARHREAATALRVGAEVDPLGDRVPSILPALRQQIRESRRPLLDWNRFDPATLTRAGALVAASLLGAAVALAVPPARKVLYSYQVVVEPKIIGVKKVEPRVIRRPAPPVLRASRRVAVESAPEPDGRDDEPRGPSSADQARHAGPTH